MTKTLKQRFRTVAKIESRQICPACPVTLERAVFVYDYELGNKLIQFVLRNNGDRPVTGAVVRFRCYDSSGQCLYPGAAPDSAIAYSDLSCAPGEYFADRRAVKLWSYDIVNYDAWVTQVTFADGSVCNFSPADYIERPPRDLLSALLEPAELKAVRRAWGRRASCVPIAVNDAIWICTCGRVCTDARCPTCRAQREKLAPQFGSEATRAFARRLIRRRGALRTSIVLVLLLGLFGAAGFGAGYVKNTLYPAATAEVSDRFLAEGRYDEAIAFARRRKDAAQEERAVDAALTAALEARDYALALVYDRLLTEPDPERIYRAAAADAKAGMAAQTVDFTAAGYGLLTANEDLYDELIHGLIDYCENYHLYRQAAHYTRMLHDMSREALAQVFDDAIADAMTRENDDETLSWAEQHPDSSRYAEIKAQLFARHFDAGDYEAALQFALTYGDDEDGLLDRVCSAVDARFFAQHIPELYFSQLSVEEQRRWHATPLALCKEVAYIDAEGKVLGLKDVQWSGAVSLAMGEFHTLCLFDDGSVEAHGSTAYGRCSVSSWSGVVAIAAGERHSVGLRAGGRAMAVGDNSVGQCNVSSWAAIIDIAAGKYHTVGLRADGTVLATGSNVSGQCNVEGYTDIIAVEAGDWTTVLLHRDGSVTVLGNTALGIDGANAWQDITAIAAGSGHVLGLRADGSVVMAGQPSAGSAGTVDGWTDVKAIAAGSVCVAGLRADGGLYLSGDGAPELH